MTLITPPTLPRIEPLGSNHYRLAEPYTYQWEHEGERYRLTVPADFESDFATVPRLLWAWIAPFDLGAATIHHDWLYLHNGRVLQERQKQELTWYRGSPHVAIQWLPMGDVQWTREDADRLFGRMVRECEVPVWKRRAAYRAVRLFGGHVWRRYTKTL